MSNGKQALPIGMSVRQAEKQQAAQRQAIAQWLKSKGLDIDAAICIALQHKLNGEMYKFAERAGFREAAPKERSH